MLSKEHYEHLGLTVSYELLINHFSLSSIEEEENTFLILQAIRRKITERFEEISNLFDKLLHPEQNYINLYESSYLQKYPEIITSIKKLFKQLNAYLHQSNYCEIIAKEEQERRFIEDAASWWETQQKTFAKIFLLLAEAWKSEEHTSSMQAYFG